MSTKPVFTGTGVALITPFLSDKSIDEKGLRTLVQNMIRGGVDFLVPLGTTGESVTLSEEESDQVIRLVLEENASKLPVLLGCGGNDTARIIKLQEKYQKTYHPDGFLSVTPYYNKPSQEGLYRHYKALAEATDTSIVLYNVPGRTGVNMLPDTVVRLAKECSNIIAIKEASGNVEQGAEILRRKPESFVVLSGDDTLVLPQLSIGYEGCISVAANGFPKQFSDLVRFGMNGSLMEGRALYLKLLPWMQLLFKEGNPAGIKGSLSVSGVCGPYVRLPLAEATQELTRMMELEIGRIGY
jgi:4-hydroxy-tetrahydrodipicolinate synthase